MTVETCDAALRVPAHLELVNHRVLLPDVAFSALARGLDSRGRRLLDFHARPRPVDHERADDQGERDDDGDEDRTEGHGDRITPNLRSSDRGDRRLPP